MAQSNSKKTFTEEIKGTTTEIIRQVKRIIKEGNARRVMIQNEKGKVVFQSQLTAGVAGSVLLTVIAPLISAIGMFALMMNNIKIIVEKYPVDESEDNYEVEAEFVEIRDGDESSERDTEKQEEKTVGRDHNKE